MLSSFFSFFNDPATTEIYTLSLHDALPISDLQDATWKVRDVVTNNPKGLVLEPQTANDSTRPLGLDRKSTRLNSSHRCISYAVFCLKKKKKKKYKIPNYKKTKK